MKKADAVKYFKNASRLARALGISRVAVSKWGKEVPPLRAFELERLTNGELKADYTPVTQDKE